MQKAARTTPRHSAKREAILDAAQELFCEAGFANTSMDMVATRAGVSKATIYAHFQGKEDLFGATVQRRCDTELSFGRFKELEAADARTTLTAMAGHLTRLILSPAALGVFRTVVAEAVRQPELAQAFFEAGPMRGRANIIAVLEGLVRRGELPPIADPWRAADQFIALLRGEHYNRALLGLPQVDGRGADESIAATVDAFMKIYGR